MKLENLTRATELYKELELHESRLAELSATDPEQRLEVIGVNISGARNVERTLHKDQGYGESGRHWHDITLTSTLSGVILDALKAHETERIASLKAELLQYGVEISS